MAEWTEGEIARIRDLWAEGHSAAEIGRRMGKTKCSIVGKVHRLELPPRPSPIKCIQDGAKAALSIRAPASRPLQPILARASAGSGTTTRMRSEIPAGAVRAAPEPVRREIGRKPCCWPIGEPGTREFRFCDAEAVKGRPYCTQHTGQAYERVRDRREDAPAREYRPKLGGQLAPAVGSGWDRFGAD